MSVQSYPKFTKKSLYDSLIFFKTGTFLFGSYSDPFWFGSSLKTMTNGLKMNHRISCVCFCFVHSKVGSPSSSRAHFVGHVSRSAIVHGQFLRPWRASAHVNLHIIGAIRKSPLSYLAHSRHEEYYEPYAYSFFCRFLYLTVHSSRQNRRVCLYFHFVPSDTLAGSRVPSSALEEWLVIFKAELRTQ